MKTYIKLFRYLLPYKGLIVVTWLISILLLCLDGISVWVGAGFLEKVISGKPLVVAGGDVNFLTRVLDYVSLHVLRQATPFKSLVAGAVVLIAARMFISLLRILKLYIFTMVDETVLLRIRSELFEHVTRLDISFSRRFRPGEVSSIFIQDVNKLHFALINTVDRLFLQPLRLILAMVLLFSLSTWISLIILLFLVLGGVVIHLFGRRIERLWRISMEKIAQVQGHITEYLSAVLISRSLGKEAQETRRFSEVCGELKRVTIKRAVNDLLAPQTISAMAVLVYGTLIMFGGYEVLVAKRLAGGTLLKMALLLPLATYSIEALASVYTSLRGAGASAKRVFALMEEPVAAEDKPDAAEAKPVERGISFSGVSFVIGERNILTDLDFTLEAGRTTVIYGPSGAGKTTILNLLAGFIRPSSGKIRVDGTDLNDLKINSWRGHLGIVTQDPVLLNGTVRDNLLYALPGAGDEFLIEIMKQALLWDGSGCVFPGGLDTPVGNRGEMLSGGERQRLTVARALLNRPGVLLMDEPTSMLDYDSKIKIRDTVAALSGSRTIIIVTHDPVLREIGEVEILLEEGGIV